MTKGHTRPAGFWSETGRGVVGTAASLTARASARPTVAAAQT